MRSVLIVLVLLVAFLLSVIVIQNRQLDDHYTAIVQIYDVLEEQEVRIIDLETDLLEQTFQLEYVSNILRLQQ